MATEIKPITEPMVKALSNPLPKDAIKPHPTKNYLSTIKAIYVTERLSQVFGTGKWQLKTELLKLEEGKTSKGKTEYTSLIKTILEIPEYGVYYECIAGSTNEDMGDATKGGTTDAITKIGSYLGIGIDVFKGNPNTQPQQQSQLAKQKTMQPPVDLDKLAKELLQCLTVEDLSLLKGNYINDIKGDVDIKKMFVARHEYLTKQQPATT